MSHPVKEWSIIEPSHKVKNCIVALAGRAMGTDHLARFCHEMQLENTLIVSLRGNNYAWYPQPFSAADQKAAVAGLDIARQNIETVVRRIMSAWGFFKNEIVLMGFSAGAVMTLHTATHSKEPFRAAVSLSGAILEPENVPVCREEIKETDFLLSHSHGDDCFDWFERYVPMKKALVENNYSLYTLEKNFGGHFIGHRDMLSVSEFLAPRLGYGEDWIHPENREPSKIEKGNRKTLHS